jgi:hypothetical protein
LLILAGGDEGAGKELHEFLDELGYRLDVLDLKSNERAIAEILGAAGAASFAVVCGDRGPADATNGEWLYTLGFCAGRLGTARMFVVCPSGDAKDRHGIQHMAMDDSGGWQLKLARHLKRAGVPVDLNRLV